MQYIDQIYATFDKQKQAELWSKLGDVLFKNHHVIPLFWLPAELIINPQFVAAWPYPGSVSRVFSHFDLIKATK